MDTAPHKHVQVGPNPPPLLLVGVPHAPHVLPPVEWRKLVCEVSLLQAEHEALGEALAEYFKELG